jgi:hypothetical protein
MTNVSHGTTRPAGPGAVIHLPHAATRVPQPIRQSLDEFVGTKLTTMSARSAVARCATMCGSGGSSPPVTSSAQGRSRLPRQVVRAARDDVADAAAWIGDVAGIAGNHVDVQVRDCLACGLAVKSARESVSARYRRR